MTNITQKIDIQSIEADLFCMVQFFYLYRIYHAFRGLKYAALRYMNTKTFHDGAII